jgi:hypothetical protein
MTLASRNENAVAPASVPVHRWPSAENASSAAFSVTCYKLVEHFRVFAVIEAERDHPRDTAADTFSILCGSYR